MKLSQALSQRADLQKRIQQLRSRLKDCAWVQEGDSPAEDPKELRRELDACLEQFSTLVYSINRTNFLSKDPEGRTLTFLIAERDALSLKVNSLRDISSSLSESSNRYSRSEIKHVRTMDLGALNREIDALSKELRELDTTIQGLNWTVDLIEE